MWIIIAMISDIGLYFIFGNEVALDFLGGYLIELSLSVDNLFVFLSIFTAFSVPEQFRQRVLHYGIIGAAVLRMIFVLCGAAIVTRFEWVLYVFGLILMINGVKMLFQKQHTYGEDMGALSWGMKLVKKVFPVTEDFCGSCFFVKRKKPGEGDKKYRYATPLFVVLVVIELSDIIFAMDSVPAVFSVTTNPWIVYSSNLLAVLGLRQMYFGLEMIAKRFVYVKYGIAAVLIFTGVKLLLQLSRISIPTVTSVLVILTILFCSMAASVFVTKKGSV